MMGLFRVLKVYPNGDGVGMDNSLSLYLLSESNEKDYVRAKLRVLNQIRSNQVEKQGEWFHSLCPFMAINCDNKYNITIV